MSGGRSSSRRSDREMSIKSTITSMTADDDEEEDALMEEEESLRLDGVDEADEEADEAAFLAEDAAPPPRPPPPPPPPPRFPAPPADRRKGKAAAAAAAAGADLRLHFPQPPSSRPQFAFGDGGGSRQLAQPRRNSLQQPSKRGSVAAAGGSKPKSAAMRALGRLAGARSA